MAKLLLFSETSEDPALIIPATNTEKTLHLSYRALHNVVVKAHIHLAALGIGPGSTVALAIRNRIEFVIIFLALIRQGATTSPLNPDCSVRETSEILRYMKPMYTIVAANHQSVTYDQNIIEGSKLQGIVFIVENREGELYKVIILALTRKEYFLQSPPTVNKESDQPEGLEEPHFVAFCQLGVNGYINTTHGGVLAALLDETLGLCAETYRVFISDEQEHSLTARVEVDYHSPVPPPRIIVIKTWVKRTKGWKWFLEAHVLDHEGSMKATAKSLYIRLKSQL
ncbi:HotDog domain-containing protein [Aspergillus arachidicola]|uniref:HotDog domain-containing protein n=1 Tax=Aspergillus arachidicola TaxID=656916 RepID=A0A5N6YI11_9EURO|nr:HotDog domain-containing protein [Aspergillus arachidicola]